MSNVRSTQIKKGRPDKYHGDYPQQTRKLCMLGYTDAQLASFFGVAERTWNRWKKSHPDLKKAMTAGKAVADSDVAESLYKRATGYSHPDTDIRVIDGQIVTTELVKHYPPDTVACIFWLKNRQRELWRDKQDTPGNDQTTETSVGEILELIRKGAEEPVPGAP